ncbi:MAG: hypothetical protein ABFD52_05200 [Acidobacteriota bacterium]
MKRSALIVALSLWTSAAATACRPGNPGDASKFTVEIIDGIKYVHNHAPQVEASSSPRLELLGKIGALEGREDKDVLYDPADAARLPNGDILVLERGGCAVKRFNERYELVSSFGRKGLGPGDLVSPYLMRLNPAGDLIYIADSRISRFRTDGTFVDSFRPVEAGATNGSSITEDFRTSGLAVLSSGRVVLPGDASVWSEPRQRHLLSVYDQGGSVARAFGEIRPYDNVEMSLNANVVHFAAGAGDDCFVAYAHQNRIDRYSAEGTLRLSADRPLPYEIKNVMRDTLFASGSVQHVFSWPSVTSVAGGAAIDGKNRLWVLTFLLQPDKFGRFPGVDDWSRCYRFDVFDADGLLMFSVPAPESRFNGFSITGDRMYLIDSIHESCVYEFLIAGGK